jgi:predicted deacetylase
VQHAASFIVIVHDVAPPFLSPLHVIADALRPLIGGAVAGAVVPCWHGSTSTSDYAFWEHTRKCYGEVLLHGYTHRSQRRFEPTSLLTEQANEFTGLSLAEAQDRVQQGQAALGDLLGTLAHGFVPPAWQPGPLTPAALASAGLRYQLSFRYLSTIEEKHPLTVWSWDCGRIAALGLLGGTFGTLHFTWCPTHLPCVVLHPRDVARGFLRHALARVQQLLASGRQPMLPRELVKGRLNCRTDC